MMQSALTGQAKEFFAYNDTSTVKTPPNQATPNQWVDLAGLVAIIKSEPPKELGELRSIIKSELAKGTDWATIKKMIEPLKTKLPWFLLSGYCPEHHNNKTLEYNGFTQIDIDFKHVGGDNKALAVFDQIKHLEFVVFAAISPSGYGVKALVATDNTDVSRHKEASRQVIEEIRRRCGLDAADFDSLGASQPCFVPFDRYMFHRDNYTLFNVRKTAETATVTTTNVDFSSGDAWSICDAFAKEKGFEMMPGKRHMYLTHFAICANLLGIDLAELKAYVSQTWPTVSIESNCFEPYQIYGEDFGGWKYKLASSDRQTIHLLESEKVSKHAESLSKFILANSRIIFQAGMGTGKSWAMVNKVAKRLTAANGCKIVIVLPLNSKTEKDAAQYKIPYVTGELSKTPQGVAMRQKALESDVFLCNQNSFPGIAAHFEAKGEKLNIAIDEAHLIASGASYKMDVILEMMKAAERVGATVTLFTATPVPYFQQMGYKFLKFEKKTGRKIKAKFRTRGKDIVKNAFDLITETDFSDGKRLMIKIQSKTKIELLRSLLLASGYDDSEVVRLYSEKHIKELEAYQIFRDAKEGEESFADTVKIILCTSFVNEGVDVYSEREIVFCSIERTRAINVNDTVQFPGRWRTSKDVNYLVFVPHDDREERPFAVNAGRKFANLSKHWQGIADATNTMLSGSDIDDSMGITMRTQYSNHENFLYFDDAEELVKVNHYFIMSFCEEMKAKATDVERAITEITARFPYFEITDERTPPIEEEESEELATAKADVKSRKAENQSFIFDMLTTDSAVFLQAVGLRSDDVELKKKIDFCEARRDAAAALIAANVDTFQTFFRDAEKAAKRLIRLKGFELSEAEAIQIIFTEKDGKTALLSDQRFATFVRRFKLCLGFSQYAKDKKGLALLSRKDVELMLKIKERIKAAAKPDTVDSSKLVISSEEIEKIVLDEYKPDKWTSSHMTKKKAVALFNDLLQAKQVLRGGELGKCWLIVGVHSIPSILSEFSIPNYPAYLKERQTKLGIASPLTINELRNKKPNFNICKKPAHFQSPTTDEMLTELGYPASWDN